MGIKNLSKVIKKVAPNAILRKPLSELSGKIVGVDISLSLYQVVCGIGRSGRLTHNDKDITHLYGTYKRFESLRKHGIKLVAVFDGNPPELKLNTLKERASKPSQYTITDEHIEDVKNLCEAMKIPIIQAKSEADIDLAILYKDGKIDYILSNDGDIIIFGGMKLIRSIKNNEATITDGDILIEELDKLHQKNLTESSSSESHITHESLVELGCLLGNDYNGNPKGIGVVRALGGMIEFNDMEKVLAKYKRESDLSKLESSKMFFIQSTSNYTFLKDIVFKKVNYSELHEFLTNVIGIKNYT
jgi:flap endonuclease-1